MLQTSQGVENLEGCLQKPWPKGVLMRPEKWHILAYLGAGITITGVAGMLFSVGHPPETYVAPLAVVSAMIMYIRAAQFYNYFYGH